MGEQELVQNVNDTMHTHTHTSDTIAEEQYQKHPIR